MALNLLNQLNDHVCAIASVEASAVGNIEALMEGFSPISVPLIVEDAARVLSNISIKVGSGKKNSPADINAYIAFRILATPINRDIVNVKPPLLKLLIQRAGQSADVDNALQKLAGHPEFQDLRRQILSDFEAAADDDEKARELASEINKLQVGYARLGEKLQATS